MEIYFATFGSDQLPGFKVDPLKTAVYIPDEPEHILRLALREPPFNNGYCTTYPMHQFEEMQRKHNTQLLTLDELMKLHKG